MACTTDVTLGGTGGRVPPRETDHVESGPSVPCTKKARTDGGAAGSASDRRIRLRRMRTRPAKRRQAASVAGGCRDPASDGPPARSNSGEHHHGRVGRECAANWREAAGGRSRTGSERSVRAMRVDGGDPPGTDGRVAGTARNVVPRIARRDAETGRCNRYTELNSVSLGNWDSACV